MYEPWTSGLRPRTHNRYHQLGGGNNRNTQQRDPTKRYWKGIMKEALGEQRLRASMEPTNEVLSSKKGGNKESQTRSQR